MGNCMVQQKKVMIKVVTTDNEETVELNKPAIQVHAVSDAPPPSAGKKTAAAAGDGAGVLRIKVIISKQELQAIMDKGGVTVEDVLVSRLHNLSSKTNLQVDRSFRSRDQRKIRPAGVGWVPELESIPEGNL